MLRSSVVEAGWTWVLLPFWARLVVAIVATGRTLLPMIWGHAEGDEAPGREQVSLAVPKRGFLLALVALGLFVPAPVNALLILSFDAAGIVMRTESLRVETRKKAESEPPGAPFPPKLKSGENITEG